MLIAFAHAFGFHACFWQARNDRGGGTCEIVHSLCSHVSNFFVATLLAMTMLGAVSWQLETPILSLIHFLLITPYGLLLFSLFNALSCFLLLQFVICVPDFPSTPSTAFSREVITTSLPPFFKNVIAASILGPILPL